MNRLGDRFTVNYMAWYAELSRIEKLQLPVLTVRTFIENAKDDIVQFTKQYKHLIQGRLSLIDVYISNMPSKPRNVVNISDREDMTDLELAVNGLCIVNSSIYDSGLYEDNGTLIFKANIDNYFCFPNLILVDLMINANILVNSYSKSIKKEFHLNIDKSNLDYFKNFEPILSLFNDTFSDIELFITKN